MMPRVYTKKIHCQLKTKEVPRCASNETMWLCCYLLHDAHNSGMQIQWALGIGHKAWVLIVSHERGEQKYDLHLWQADYCILHILQVYTKIAMHKSNREMCAFLLLIRTFVPYRLVLCRLSTLGYVRIVSTYIN